MKLAIPDREFSGYIFDCDGTLADTMPLHYRAWTRIIAELGGSFPIDLFYQLGGRPTAQILSLLRDEHGLKVDDVQKAAKRKEEYFLEMIGEVKPIEEVVQVACDLDHSGFSCALAPGFSSNSTVWRAIICSSSVGITQIETLLLAAEMRSAPRELASGSRLMPSQRLLSQTRRRISGECSPIPAVNT